MIFFLLFGFVLILSLAMIFIAVVDLLARFVLLSSPNLALPLILVVSGLVNLASLRLTIPELFGHTFSYEAVLLRVTLLSKGVSANQEFVVLS